MQWPVLKEYDQAHLGCIGLPLGGIGTGTVSLGGRGHLFDWEIHNRPGKNTGGAENFMFKDYGANSLFAITTRGPDGKVFARVLEGVLQPPYDGSHGSTAGFHGAPRFRECRFQAAYPLGQVLLDDPDSPVAVRLEAFNPLVPADADASGYPVAILRYVVTNKTQKALAATVCGSLANLAAGDTRSNVFRRDNGLEGLFMCATDGDPTAEKFGTMALVATAGDISHKATWPDESWRRPLLHFWDDLTDDGRLDSSPEGLTSKNAMGSVAATAEIAPGGEASFPFIIAWHFPNRYNWSPRTSDCQEGNACLLAADRIGNYYTNRFRDAWDAAAQTAADLAELESRTVRFVKALCECDLPEPIKEAALFNASTLRTETCFRTPDGKLYGWEGCCDDRGCCQGSCTHVWNYETTTAFLFGDLARSMREVEFLHATHPETGQMSFRVVLPLDREKGQGAAAADGQMGCIMKAFREWTLSGDDSWLAALWPRVRKALEFCWVKGGWDEDRDGVMEGCQHNTMDVEYFGPNAQMGTWYLGALRAAEEMARAVGEPAFAENCRKLFESGSAWLDGHLFNGEYYEQEIRVPESVARIHPALRVGMGTGDVTHPDLQLGPACLVDQLVGQYMAHVCGLGYLLKTENVRAALRAVMAYNFKEDFYGHFNHMRSYVLNDESAMVMATFPRGQRPESPFPYFSEVMTGFEYTAATHMLYEDLQAEGLRAIAAIRARYDGLRRSPFNEAECGHHYARAMAAWTGILAWTGFHYDATARQMSFAPREGRFFWSNGYAFGTVDIRHSSDGWKAAVTTIEGTLPDDLKITIENRR